MREITLRQNPAPDDQTWDFSYPPRSLTAPPPRPKVIFGKCISLTADAIILRSQQLESNRILNSDDPTKFVLFSIDRRFRFPEEPLKVATDYVIRMLKKGVKLNGIQYRFYGHSNSQLRSRSCYLREANTDEELDARIYQLGEFERIMNVAKRAKRIGLLFSSSQMDYNLDPRWIADIPDITVGEEVFSDGCGLISKNLAVQLSKSKEIVFRGARYTPTVFQIRYLGYKGVLMLHPDLDKGKKHLAQFRKSMKKFNTTADKSFSVVGFSKPYSFGRLNNDVIVLLSSLGVSDAAFLSKQQQYFNWVREASTEREKALDFLCCMDKYDMAERALLEGVDDDAVKREIRRLQNAEIAGARHEGTDKFKSRIMVHKSRRLYGVCDPYQVLEEGQVHIRITESRRGPSTPIHGDVIVVKNPCLHPGDILKLRATNHPQLSHLVDCLVFASVARPGHKAAPSMSSGGDLDGDDFFVCWDPDIIPKTISESYDYPANREFTKPKVTRQDLAMHFASYNLSGVAKVSTLHAQWVRSSPLGALCVQCQELNALHSQSVDGAPIRIPDKLATPPERKAGEPPFILDQLKEAADQFAADFSASATQRAEISTLDRDEAESLVGQLLRSEQHSISEFELFNLAFRFCDKYGVDMRKYLAQIDFSALTTAQKHAASAALSLSGVEYPEIWNSLARSDILKQSDLYQKRLDRPFSLHRLYSSRLSGLSTFFEYLKMATQDYTRKVLILQTDSRFSVGIFMRGAIPWDEDPEVNRNVVVCVFMPQSAATIPTLKTCTPGFRLHCSDYRLQLYNRQIGNTFIFINRPMTVMGTEISTSIALDVVSSNVKKQIGRINRTPVAAIELHVVSNRDRVAHQLFDLWFDHVPTEERVRRFQRQPAPYRFNNLLEVDWNDEHVADLKDIFYRRAPGVRGGSSNMLKHTPESMEAQLALRSRPDVERIMGFALDHHAEHELFLIFSITSKQEPTPVEFITRWLDRHPMLAFVLLKAYPPSEDGSIHAELEPITQFIVRNIIRTANATRIAALVALQKMAKSIGMLPLNQYIDCLMLAAMSVRSLSLTQEVLLVLNDSRVQHCPPSPAADYARQHALGVAFDRAEEAADECPCDEDGKPRKKQRVAPSHAKLSFTPDYAESGRVQATTRIDAQSGVRLHSHVRLQAASRPENQWIDAPIMDGIVVQAGKGELKIDLFHPAPPEMEEMDWNMYDSGSTATAKAMMDAIRRLILEKEECCAFYKIIVGDDAPSVDYSFEVKPPLVPSPEGLNTSQLTAMNSWTSLVSLIWGPPGTGKTTVIVQVLRDMIKRYPETPKILMTASTHNAVDNVLERFIAINATEGLLRDEEILRVATDQSKVNSSLQDYTINARVGGDMNENNRLVKQALDRVKNATIVFTTCAGAGLGVLRNIDFDVALIDEASQITEPCALIPLVKNIKRAVIVGDHVQLRPTVRNMGKAILYDVSLMERLYTSQSEIVGLSKTMLDVQYRSPRDLNIFPSMEFYEGKLQTHPDNADASDFLRRSQFPWPIKDGKLLPTVFIDCHEEEEMGARSKGNQGQAAVIQRLIPLITAQRPDAPPDEPRLAALKTTVLSPYTRQLKLLRERLPSSVICSTVDSFQGRESDIIVFSTVRSNVDADIGFLDDHRRLNVMWTRARLGLIIVGDSRTLNKNPLWKRALEACTTVSLSEQ